VNKVGRFLCKSCNGHSAAGNGVVEYTMPFASFGKDIVNEYNPYSGKGKSVVNLAMSLPQPNRTL
jgi:hypothetical protein